MVGVDIGDDGDHRLQVEETGVALVCLGHQIMTRAQTGMTAAGVQPSADHIGGIQTALGQQRSHERGRRRLPMGARHGDAETETHQFRQHLRAGNHRDARLAGRSDLRVVVADGRRRHHHLGTGDLSRIVPPVDPGAEFRQPPGHGIAAQIRSADLVPQIQHHLGNAAHPRAAATDEMHPPDAAHGIGIAKGVHTPVSRRSQPAARRQWATTASVAPGIAFSRARAAIRRKVSGWVINS